VSPAPAPWAATGVRGVSRPDITTKELRREIDAKGLAFGYGTIHRFFTRHGLTWKKRQAMPTNRIAPTF